MRTGRRSAVFIQIDDEPIYTVNGRHVISEIVTLCGGRNVFAELPQLAPPICGRGGAGGRPAGDPEHGRHDCQAARTFWQPVAANEVRCRSGNVFKLPSDLVTRASPRLAQGVEVTCSALERARLSPVCAVTIAVAEMAAR